MYGKNGHKNLEERVETKNVNDCTYQRRLYNVYTNDVHYILYTFFESYPPYKALYIVMHFFLVVVPV
jgi:hypothetical protein